jgi:hypothetical protein
MEGGGAGCGAGCGAGWWVGGGEGGGLSGGSHGTSLGLMGPVWDSWGQFALELGGPLLDEGVERVALPGCLDRGPHLLMSGGGWHNTAATWGVCALHNTAAT